MELRFRWGRAVPRGSVRARPAALGGFPRRRRFRGRLAVLEPARRDGLAGADRDHGRRRGTRVPISPGSTNPARAAGRQLRLVDCRETGQRRAASQYHGAVGSAGVEPRCAHRGDRGGGGAAARSRFRRASGRGDDTPGRTAPAGGSKVGRPGAAAVAAGAGLASAGRRGTCHRGPGSADHHPARRAAAVRGPGDAGGRRSRGWKPGCRRACGGACFFRHIACARRENTGPSVGADPGGDPGQCCRNPRPGVAWRHGCGRAPAASPPPDW